MLICVGRDNKLYSLMSHALRGCVRDLILRSTQSPHWLYGDKFQDLTNTLHSDDGREFIHGLLGWSSKPVVGGWRFHVYA